MRGEESDGWSQITTELKQNRNLSERTAEENASERMKSGDGSMILAIDLVDEGEYWVSTPHVFVGGVTCLNMPLSGC